MMSLSRSTAVDLLRLTQAQLALSGAENVRSRSWHSSIEYFGSPSVVADELEREQIARVADREDAVKTSCGPSFFAVAAGTSICRKSRKRLQLDVEQVRDLMSHSRSILRVVRSVPSCRLRLFKARPTFLARTGNAAGPGRRGAPVSQARRRAADRAAARTRPRSIGSPADRLLDLDGRADFFELAPSARLGLGLLTASP